MSSVNSIASVNGYVNFAYVMYEEVDAWKSKGFKENPSFSSEFWDDPE